MRVARVPSPGSDPVPSDPAPGSDDAHVDGLRQAAGEAVVGAGGRSFPAELKTLNNPRKLGICSRVDKKHAEPRDHAFRGRVSFSTENQNEALNSLGVLGGGGLGGGGEASSCSSKHVPRESRVDPPQPPASVDGKRGALEEKYRSSPNDMKYFTGRKKKYTI